MPLSSPRVVFDPDCSECERLYSFRIELRKKYPDYFCKPVPPFGDPKGKMVIVGLAPGMHGANATGRPFTGDHAGILLYETLHKFGFSNRAESRSSDDGLRLKNCWITNAVKCLPPENKPIGAEVRTCNQFLSQELADVPKGGVMLALGTIAHQSVLRALGLKLKDYKFGHAALFELPDGRYLLDSYHCSRYNTQTRRLTEPMFHDVFRTAKKLIRA